MNSTKQMIKKLIKEQMTSVLLARPSDDEIIMEQQRPLDAREQAIYKKCDAAGGEMADCLDQAMAGRKKGAAVTDVAQQAAAAKIDKARAVAGERGDKGSWQNQMLDLIKKHGPARPVVPDAVPDPGAKTAYFFGKDPEPKYIKTPQLKMKLKDATETLNKMIAKAGRMPAAGTGTRSQAELAALTKKAGGAKPVAQRRLADIEKRLTALERA